MIVSPSTRGLKWFVDRRAAIYLAACKHRRRASRIRLLVVPKTVGAPLTQQPFRGVFLTIFELGFGYLIPGGRIGCRFCPPISRTPQGGLARGAPAKLGGSGNTSARQISGRLLSVRYVVVRILGRSLAWSAHEASLFSFRRFGVDRRLSTFAARGRRSRVCPRLRLAARASWELAQS